MIKQCDLETVATVAAVVVVVGAEPFFFGGVSGLLGLIEYHCPQVSLMLPVT